MLVLESGEVLLGLQKEVFRRLFLEFESLDLTSEVLRVLFQCGILFLDRLKPGVNSQEDVNLTQDKIDFLT